MGCTNRGKGVEVIALCQPNPKTCKMSIWTKGD